VIHTKRCWNAISPAVAAAAVRAATAAVLEACGTVEVGHWYSIRVLLCKGGGSQVEYPPRSSKRKDGGRDVR